jgi:hypothetical protein
VYRQATILLAGLAIDPASFLFSLQRSPASVGGLPGAQVRRGERFALRWRSEMTGNKIRVLTR